MASDDVLGGDVLHARQVGDGAGHLEDAVVAAGGETEAGHRQGEQLARRRPAAAHQRRACRPLMRALTRTPVPAKRSSLPARAATTTRSRIADDDSPPPWPASSRVRHGGDLEVEVDAVEQRAREPRPR